MEEQVLALRNFKSGWITRVPSEVLPDDAFSDVQNIALDEKFVPTKAKGHQKYNSGGLASASVQGGAVYTLTTGTKYYVVTCGGKIYYSVAGSGTFTAYQIGGGDLTIDASGEVEFVQYLNCLWAVNGKYPIITNAGYGTSRMIKISDTTPSAITAGPPQGGKKMIVHQERIFIGGSTDQPNGLYWSEPYLPETWTPAYGVNYDFVGKDDGENITGIKSFQGYVYVGKPRNLYRYLTSGDITEWESRRVDTNLGWLYHRTIQEFYGYLIYLSSEGVVLFDGNSANLVSESIRNDILALPQMKKNVRQWLQSTTEDFDAGTAGAPIDTSDNELKLKAQKSEADWEAGIAQDVNLAISPGDVKFNPLSLPNETPSGYYPLTVKVGNCIYFLMLWGSTSRLFWKYSIEDNTWDKLTDYPVAAGGFPQMCFDGTYIYVVRTDNTATFYRYNIFANSWSQMADLPATVFRPSGLVFNGVYIYLARGFNTKTFWRYDISANTWGSLADTPDVVSGGTGAVSDGTYIYLPQGIGKSTFWRYNISTDSWGSLTGYAVGGAGGSNTLVYDGNNHIYLIQREASPNFFYYNISGNSWHELSSVASNDCAAIVYDGTYVYAAAVSSSTFYRYSIGSDSWILDPWFITKTLDFGFTPAVYGHLAAEIAGSVMFKTKSSDTDLSASEWQAATGWSDVQANNTAIVSTAKRYLRVMFDFDVSASGTVSQLFVGAIFRSQKKDLGSAPASWGTFETAYLLNSQTITFWMRSADTANDLDSAGWKQQTPGTPIPNVDFKQWIQWEARFNTTLFSQQPTVDSVTIVYYVGAGIASPCSITCKNGYWLNVAGVGSDVNNVVLRYDKTGYWLKRANKKNNIYCIDENYLLSGTSESDGFVRYNDTGTKDDAADIDSWFVTKNFEITSAMKLFRSIFVTSRSAKDWTFSYSLDNGNYIDVTIGSTSLPTTIKKILAGINSGRFIKFKVRQALEDSEFEFSGGDVIWSVLRELAVT